MNSQINVLKYRNRMIQKLKKFLTGDSILDVGCGDGNDLMLYKKYFNKVEGIDIQENENWKNIKDENIKVKKGNAENLDYYDNSFDIVIEKDMLHHAENPEKALSEMIRVSKKRVIVLEANRYNPIFFVHLTLMEGHNHFTQKNFKKLIFNLDKNAKILHFSNRVYPFKNEKIIDAFYKISDFLEKIPFLIPFIEYNAGIIEK